MVSIFIACVAFFIGYLVNIQVVNGYKKDIEGFKAMIHDREEAVLICRGGQKRLKGVLILKDSMIAKMENTIDELKDKVKELTPKPKRKYTRKKKS